MWLADISRLNNISLVVESVKISFHQFRMKQGKKIEPVISNSIILHLFEVRINQCATIQQSPIPVISGKRIPIVGSCQNGIGNFQQKWYCYTGIYHGNWGFRPCFPLFHDLNGLLTSRPPSPLTYAYVLGTTTVQSHVHLVHSRSQIPLRVMV